MTDHVAPVPAPERQFSLMLALVLTTQGLTKSQIYASVHGYRRAFEDAGRSAALDKMFERDKAELRELGLALETFDDPAAPGDNQLTRYRIASARSALPPGTRMNEEETLLLALAAAVWREGSLSGESRRGLMKLHALGADVDAGPIAVSPRWRLREAAFEPFAAAIEAGRVVEFSYLKPGADEAELRRVEPLALVRHDGRWLLGAFDLARDAERTFLLSRVLGGVRKRGDVDPGRAADRAGRDEAAWFLDRLRTWSASRPAEVAVRPGSDAELRLTRRGESAPVATEDGDWPTVTLHAGDEALLADELAAFGPEVRVVSPASLRDAVVERLRRVLAEHGAAA